MCVRSALVDMAAVIAAGVDTAVVGRRAESAGCSSVGWGGSAMVRDAAGREVGSMGLWRRGIGVGAAVAVGRMVWGRRRVEVRLMVAGSAKERGLSMVVEAAVGRWMTLGSIPVLPFCRCCYCENSRLGFVMCGDWRIAAEQIIYRLRSYLRDAILGSK